MNLKSNELLEDRILMKMNLTKLYDCFLKAYNKSLQTPFLYAVDKTKKWPVIQCWNAKMFSLCVCELVSGRK